MKGLVKTAIHLVLLLMLAACQPEKPAAREVKPLAALPAESSEAPAPTAPPPDADAALTGTPQDEPAPEGIIIQPGKPAKLLLDLPVASTESASNLQASGLTQLTEALRAFVQNKKRIPKKLDELVEAGLIASVPPPPEGQQYEIDKLRLEVTVR